VNPVVVDPNRLFADEQLQARWKSLLVLADGEQQRMRSRLPRRKVAAVALSNKGLPVARSGRNIMRNLYEASNAIEANILKGLLEVEGIEVFINGEYLQGGMGDLPVSGIITLSVEECDVARALKIIEAYEAGEFELKDS
jgi:hypothetical protein